MKDPSGGEAAGVVQGSADKEVAGKLELLKVLGRSRHSAAGHSRRSAAGSAMHEKGVHAAAPAMGVLASGGRLLSCSPSHGLLNNKSPCPPLTFHCHTSTLPAILINSLPAWLTD